MTTNPTPTIAVATSPRDLQGEYRQARDRCEADPANPHLRRTLAWVLADLLKAVSAETTPRPDRLVRGLDILADFDLDDSRWRESVLWSVCRFLFRHTPRSLPLGQLAAVVSRAQLWIDPTPSLVRSVWWKALLRHADTGLDWLGLFDRLGWEGGFRPEDFVGDTLPTAADGTPGQPMKPLVERLMTVAMKQLLAGVVIQEATAALWLERLTDLAARYPDWHFLAYYHARLLQRLDRPAEAMTVFLPVARQKKTEFWIWSLLADLLTQTSSTRPEEVLACYARALTTGAPEPFLVKVRQRAARCLIGQHRWADARAEIDRLIQIRQAQQWPIPDEVQQWLNEAAYTQARPVEPGNWYAALTPAAERLLWQDLPETVALVTRIDLATGQVMLAIEAKTTGKLNHVEAGTGLVVGSRLAIRYTSRQKADKTLVRVLSAQPTDALPTHLEPRTVTGPLRMLPGKAVGFVGNVYVGADVLTGQPDLADRLVRVVAVASWDVGKQKEGWRAFQIQPEVVNLLGG